MRTTQHGRRIRAWAARHRDLAVAAAGGALFALSTPPTDLYPCVLVGLGLLLAALRSARRFWSGFLRGAVWASAAGLVGLRFVPSVIQLFTDLGTAAAIGAHLLVAVGQSLNWALGMGLATTCRRRWGAPWELSFGLGMLVALWLPGVFVWSPAAFLSPWPVLVQTAEYVGDRGVSVLLSLVAALTVRGIVRLAAARQGSAPTIREGWLALAAAAGLLGGLAAHGAWAMARIDAAATPSGSATIGLVHAGIDPRERWQPAQHPRILRTLQEQTRQVESQGVELSVWPEAAYPYVLPHDAGHAPGGPHGVLGGGVRGPILFGLITAEPARQGRDEHGRPGAGHLRFNSATIVGRDGRLQPSYDKMQLLWFGETVPLSEYLPWLREVFHRSGGLIPGRELRALRLPRAAGAPLRIGVLNCYEDTLPHLARRIARELQPNLLVNVTNDAWFIGTSEPELHLRLATMRTIELRRDMVRAVNLGVAGWIDARGVVRARYQAARPGHLIVTPTLRSTATLYQHAGDVPLAAILLGLTGAAAWRRRRASPRT